MNLKTNAIAWNPMEAMVFTVASEDYNLYAFDMRKLDRPVNVQMDHTGAVIDLDYSPTGRELVSGSYDKTVRIWTTDSGRSREVTKKYLFTSAEVALNAVVTQFGSDLVFKHLITLAVFRFTTRKECRG